MKRQQWIIGMLLVVLLTGCGAKDGPNTVPESPEEPELTEKVPAPARLLLSEGALAYMYRDGRPNGFDFGGAEEDGAFLSLPARRSRISPFGSVKMKRRRLCAIMGR